MTTAPRPRSVTLACLLMGLSCLILMFSIVGQLGNWGSLQLQEQVRDALDSGPLAGASLTVTEALAILRWIFLGVLVLSIAGVVFAVFTVRGDRTSRNFLTGVWAIVGWTLAGAGGISFIGLALAVVLVYLLWMPESRQWFTSVNAGETGPTQPHAFGTGPPSTPALAPPTSVQSEAAPAPVQAPSGQKPRSVVVATTITLIGSVIVGVGSTFMLAGLALVHGEFDELVDDSPPMRDAVADLGVTTDQVFQTTLVLMIVFLILSLAGFVAALVMLARKRAGLIGLAVVASLTLVASILGFPVGIPWTVAAIVVLVQLRHPDTKAWFRTT